MIPYSYHSDLISQFTKIDLIVLLRESEPVYYSSLISEYT